LKTFILFLGLAGAAASLSASPVLYNFNFTGGSPNATGSFDYDSSTNMFSNVIVTWSGVQFPSSFTTVFNGGSPPICGGIGGPSAVFEILTQGVCGGGQWNASNFTLPGPGSQEVYNFFFTFDGNNGWNELGVPVTSSAPLLNTSGTVSASAAAPEPVHWRCVLPGERCWPGGAGSDRREPSRTPSVRSRLRSEPPCVTHGGSVSACGSFRGLSYRMLRMAARSVLAIFVAQHAGRRSATIRRWAGTLRSR
jgi:hypothetical protein